jgi:hypothetical protein
MVLPCLQDSAGAHIEHLNGAGVIADRDNAAVWSHIGAPGSIIKSCDRPDKLPRAN